MKNRNIIVLVLVMAILNFGCAPSERVSHSSTSSSQVYSQSPAPEMSEPSSSPEASLEPGEITDDPYRFGDGDVLHIMVYDEPSLSGEYRIDNTGQISFPFIGATKVEGLTSYEVQAFLESKLKEGYLKYPDVMVDVAKYRPFSILGQVASPGHYAYQEGLTIADAVAISSGFTRTADKQQFDILRRGAQEWQKSALQMKDEIKPGDIIYVGEWAF